MRLRPLNFPLNLTTLLAASVIAEPGRKFLRIELILLL
jgi:hypothetical protein